MIFEWHYSDDPNLTSKCLQFGWGTRWSKPHRAFWTSGHEWREWCELNDFATDRLRYRYRVTPHSDVRVLVIDRRNYREALPQVNIAPDDRMGFFAVDWRRVASDYDAVTLAVCPRALGYSSYYSDSVLGWDGWDVPSTVYLRPTFTLQREAEE